MYRLVAIPCLLLSAVASGQSTVEIDWTTRHEVGGVSVLDRSVFLSLHGSTSESDWTSEPDKLEYLLEDLDVYFGRETGRISGTLRSSEEDPDRPGFVDPDSIAQLVEDWREGDLANPYLERYAHRSEVIVGAQVHPFWPDGKTEMDSGWTISTTDTADEPLGTATGDFMGRYLAQMYAEGPKEKPKFVEVMNEPLWELTTRGDTPPADVFRFHNAVADGIRGHNDDVLIGGYVVAFPFPERDDFGRWDERLKSFIDIAGEKMDYWSLHFYDFPNISNGLRQLRRGSNIEAVLDLVDHYSELKLGHRKPFLISEYGSQLHEYYRKPWTPTADAEILRSGNAMLMQFLERPDQIHQTTLFAIGKAEWGRRSDDWPYLWRMMRRATEGDADLSDDREGPWVWTEVIKFFQLWSDVNGTRVMTTSDELDLQAHAYLEGDVGHIVMNSLEDFESMTVSPAMVLPSDALVESVQIKLLDYPEGAPRLTTSTQRDLPESITLPPNATAVLSVTFSKAVEPTATASESRYYATSYLKRIEANQPNTFAIESVDVGDSGRAVLRLGVGRDHGFSPFPTSVKLNGEELAVPSDVRGDNEQADRQRFFGLVEVPVPYDLLGENNEVTVRYADTTGHVSSAALKVVTTSR